MMREKRPGVWELRAYLGKDPFTGRKRYKSQTFHGGKRAAENALAAHVTKHGGTVAPTTKTLTWLVDAYLTMSESTLDKETIRTYRSYARTWIFPTPDEPMRIGALPIEDVTAGHLRDLHSGMARPRPCEAHVKTYREECKKCKAGKSPSTIHQVHQIIRGSLTYAMEHEWIDRNVAAIRKSPSVPASDVLACTDAELALLLESTDEPGCDLWAAIVLGASLGRRLGQLTMIRRSHCVVEGDTPGVWMQPTRKSPKPIFLPIDQGTARRLRTRFDWQQDKWERVNGGPYPTKLVDDPYVLSFWSDGSGPPGVSGYSGAFGDLRDKLELPHLHFHCLRHWCATTLINLGVPLTVIAERLGHSSPAVTARIYAHVIAGTSTTASDALGGALPFDRRSAPALATKSARKARATKSPLSESAVAISSGNVDHAARARQR